MEVVGNLIVTIPHLSSLGIVFLATETTFSSHQFVILLWLLDVPNVYGTRQKNCFGKLFVLSKLEV